MEKENNFKISFWDKEWDDLSDNEIDTFCKYVNIRNFTSENKYIVKKMYCLKRKKNGKIKH